MNYCLIVVSSEEYDGHLATDTHLFTMYCDSLAISHVEEWTKCKLFEMPNGKTCGARPATLNEFENMRLVKEWPHSPAQEKLKVILSAAEKLETLEVLFTAYENDLKELNQKYDNELITASTRHMVEAHGELDRAFINSIRPLLSNPQKGELHER